MRWFQLAANQGYGLAESYLGFMYEFGDAEAAGFPGEPQSHMLAYMWWNLAAAQGYNMAALSRDALGPKMTPAQIVARQSRCEISVNLDENVSKVARRREGVSPTGGASSSAARLF
jgi:TPR repeat protein